MNPLAILRHRPPTSAQPDCAAAGTQRDLREPRQACGWFDSSHELSAGLRVVEHAGIDALASELPLGEWLLLHMGGWREVRAA